MSRETKVLASCSECSLACHLYSNHSECMYNTQITLNAEAGRALTSTSNQSSEPFEVAQYPQQNNDAIGWLRLVGSFKLKVSFAEYRLFYRALLQKRPIILRSLLIEKRLVPNKVYRVMHTCMRQYATANEEESKCF